MPNNEEIFDRQMTEFQITCSYITMIYGQLLNKRLNNALTRDEYMIYDMMDMFIHLKAVLSEISQEKPYPDYMVEKLEKMKSYIDTTLEHFKARGDK